MRPTPSLLLNPDPCMILTLVVHSPPLCLSAARWRFFLRTTHSVRHATDPFKCFSSTTNVPPVTNPPHHFCAYFPTSILLCPSPLPMTLYSVMLVECHTLSISQKKGTESTTKDSVRSPHRLLRRLMGCEEYVELSGNDNVASPAELQG